MISKNSENLIEIRVDTIAQLFHTLDPFPFREKDLDREAEDYVVGWARELPANRPFRIVVHFPDEESQAKLAHDLQEADFVAEVGNKGLGPLALWWMAAP